MPNQDITTLIAGLQIEDPKLYQALMLLNERMLTVENDLFPLVRQSEEAELPELPVLAPATFTFIFEPLSVELRWAPVDGATIYEVRKGTAWDTAFFQLRTTSLQADISPLPVGSHTFLLKSVTPGNSYSLDFISLVIDVPALGTPVISARTIDNNALLSWNIPTSVFAISYYNFWKNGGLVGIVRGNFTTYFEMVGGTFLYGISAVDVAGNESARGEIPVVLAIPPDFVLESIYVSNLGALDAQAHGIYIEKAGTETPLNFVFENQSGFTTDPTHIYLALIQTSSTLVNCVREPGPKLLACWLITNWQQHFTNRSWNSPKNQTDAGYPIYIQPSALTGSYEEIVNYGAVFPNVIATISWSTQPIVGSVAVRVLMAASTDGVTYGPMLAGASQFFASIRFLKFKLEFTGEDDHALAEFFNVTISLNVKKELDSGLVTANAGDITGTTVPFNKKFKDVESITLTVEAKEPITAIYDFNDIANPVSFKVFALDSTGNRVTYPVSWKARGIV